MLSLNGCLNVDQKTKINEDLSGTMNLHYWSPRHFVDIGDVTMGDEIGGFSYVDSEIKRKYNSETMEMLDLRRYVTESDSNSHVVVSIKFTDFNKISDAPGFYNITASYVKGKDGFDFKYIIPRDTTIRTKYVSEINTLEYTFEFPEEVLETNGTKEGNVAKWKFQVADLVNQDFELTATSADCLALNFLRYCYLVWQYSLQIQEEE
jgi:CRISPR/Cas system CMR-associated protein Cmr1 (group 7 of RAMP superfamily)